MLLQFVFHFHNKHHHYYNRYVPEDIISSPFLTIIYFTMPFNARELSVAYIMKIGGES